MEFTDSKPSTIRQWNSSYKSIILIPIRFGGLIAIEGFFAIEQSKLESLMYHHMSNYRKRSPFVKILGNCPFMIHKSNMHFKLWTYNIRKLHKWPAINTKLLENNAVIREFLLNGSVNNYVVCIDLNLHTYIQVLNLKTFCSW